MSYLKSYIALGLFLFALLLLTVSAKDIGVDSDWEGIWKGKYLIQNLNQKQQSTTMELHISPIKDSQTKQWKIIYGAGQANQSVRAYELKPDGTTSGKYIIDEKNGILLDCQLLNNVLYSQFTVGGNLISSRFELLKDKIYVEMSTFDIGKPRTTTVNGGSIKVASFPLKSLQYGFLTRQ